MWQWYFLSRMKSRANWDTCYGHRPSITIWSISGKVSVSISQLPTTQLHHHYLHFSIFKVRVWMHLLGSIHTLLNRHTRELLYLSSSPRSALSSSLHLSRPPPDRERCKMEIKYFTGCLEKAFKIRCFKFHNLAAP